MTAVWAKATAALTATMYCVYAFAESNGSKGERKKKNVEKVYNFRRTTNKSSLFGLIFL